MFFCLESWAVNPSGKTLVHNLQYSPQTWLVRYITGNITEPVISL